MTARSLLIQRMGLRRDTAPPPGDGSYTPVQIAGLTYVFFNGAGVQGDFDHINNGLTGSESNAGTIYTLSGSSRDTFDFEVDFTQPTLVSRIEVHNGQSNGSIFNVASTITFATDSDFTSTFFTTSLDTQAVVTDPPQIIDVSANPAFSLPFTSFFVRFERTSSNGFVSVRELGFFTT